LYALELSNKGKKEDETRKDEKIASFELDPQLSEQGRAREERRKLSQALIQGA